MASKQIASDRPGGTLTITAVEPSAAIAGGELHIRGKNLTAGGRPSVQLGGQQAHLVIAGNSYRPAYANSWEFPPEHQLEDLRSAQPQQTSHLAAVD